MTYHLHTVDPELFARVEAILAGHNDAEGVPEEIALDMFDDMAAAAEKMAGWSCRTFRAYSLHDQCTHHDDEPGGVTPLAA